MSNQSNIKSDYTLEDFYDLVKYHDASRSNPAIGSFMVNTSLIDGISFGDIEKILKDEQL